MNLSGTTVILVNGKATRVCARHFNVALKKHGDKLIVLSTDKEPLVPSKGLSWASVAKLVREGKKATCRVDGAKKRSVKSNNNTNESEVSELVVSNG